MGDRTRIDWADATLELTSGCTKVSAGCKNCYAERLANGRLKRFHPDGFAAVRTHPERLEVPLHWRKPRRVFVCSRSDLFHEAVPDWFIVRAFAVMETARHHTFLVLTKRPARMRKFMWSAAQIVRTVGIDRLIAEGYCPGGPWPLSNVWLGVSVENQKTADERIPLLLDTPAAVRFVSVEPLLGSVDLRRWLCSHLFVQPGSWSGEPSRCLKCSKIVKRPLNWSVEVPHLDWLIVGCESGKNARPMEEAWVRSLRDQCVAAGVPLFYKQRMTDGRLEHMPALDERVWDEVPKP